jgi:nitrate reductase beta subunit
MAEVFNWQINRNMTYRFEGNRPQKQAGAVFDTNKCIACQTCTVACKTTWTSGKGQEYMLWNNVETKPWGSFPTGYDVRIMSQLGPVSWDGDTYTGKTIFESAPPEKRNLGWTPTDLDYAYPNKGEDETNVAIGSTYHLQMPQDAWFFYLPRVCNHCTYPACLQACPRTSIYKRPEDGIVLVDQERCRGYRVCFDACPYKKIFYNHTTRVSEKCTFCFPAVETGYITRCMRNCIGKIRTFGYIGTPETAREDNPVDFLVHVRKVGLPLMPQLGLEPNVYYIPPVHVGSMPYLIQMFGPGAPAAVETYKAAMAGEDKMLKAVLLLNVSTNRLVTRFEVTPTDQVLGYDVDNVEVVRIPLKEPTMVRPESDPARNVYRNNVA